MFCYTKGHSYKWLFILESILDLTLVQIVLISNNQIETSYHISSNNVFRYLKVASTSTSHLEVNAGFLSIVYEGKM